MPSAANVKNDKQISPENALTDSSCSGNNNVLPLRQGIIALEHKVRNLEKRKAKLESYRDLQNAGKELNADQKTAVAKYDEVVHCLEFSRDLCKTFLGLATTAEKEAKKQAKRDAAAKNQADLAKIREVLLIQDALLNLGYTSVREDFLNGKRGAAQLTQTNLELLDDLYPAITPKHVAGNPHTFMNGVQSASEHLLGIIDGKSKEVFGGSYSQIKEILGKIHESGYLDQVQQEEEQQEVYVETFTEQEVQLVEPVVNNDVPPEPQETLPPLETLTIEPTMPPMQVQPPIEPSPIDAALPPEQPQIFYPQPPRPLAEVLGGGNFFFLQESEVDPTLDQIPSQTFTNQSFVAGPPPPIPMPAHFQNMSAPIPSAVAPAGNNIEETHKLTEEQLKPTNNHRQRTTSSNSQSYYQNNGYANNNGNTNNSNRPRQRSGGRPNSNRH